MQRRVKVSVVWPAGIVTVLLSAVASRKFLVCVSVTETGRAAVVAPMRVSV